VHHVTFHGGAVAADADDVAQPPAPVTRWAFSAIDRWATAGEVG